MSDLLSILIPLTPTEAVEVPANLGRATRAWFLERVLAVDHRLNKRLRKPNEEKPFTVSNLLTEQRPQDGVLRLSPEQPCALRLTSYDPELSAFMRDDLLDQLPETAPLVGTTFRRGDVITRPDETMVQSWRNWVGRTTFEALVAAHTLQDPMPTRVTLHFASPTVFKSKGVFMPLPLPRLVFEGLVRRWNAFSPVQVHPDVNLYAEESIAISAYRLRTEAVRFGKEGDRGVLPGFVGSCTYALRVKDRYWMGLIHLLAAFAFYAGVGKQTTMGLGQVRSVGGGERGSVRGGERGSVRGGERGSVGA